MNETTKEGFGPAFAYVSSDGITLPHETHTLGVRVRDAENSVANEAFRLVHGDRGSVYTHPLDDFGRTAAMASALLRGKLRAGVSLTEEDVAAFMVIVKLSRLQATPGHHDSMVDGAGYFECMGMVVDERGRRGLGHDGGRSDGG